MVLSLVFVIFEGCTKHKEVHCLNTIVHIQYYAAFVGLKPEMLDTIMIHESLSTGTWDTSYIVTDTSLKIINDTSSHVLNLYPGYSYKISFPQSPLVFELKDPEYPQDEPFLAEDNCGSARSSVSPPTAITVNGQKQAVIEVSINHGVVFLK